MKLRFIFTYISLIVLFLFLFSCAEVDKENTDRTESLIEEEVRLNTLVLTTGFKPGSNSYRRYEALYSEIFRRMGYELKIVYFPIKRSILEAQSGEYLGEMGRDESFNEKNEFPDLIKINEPINTVYFYFFSLDKSMKIGSWEDLSETSYIAGFNGGMGVIEENLQKVLPADRIFRARDSDQGLKVLLAGRIDLYVGGKTTYSLVENNPDYINISNGGEIFSQKIFPIFHKNYEYLIENFLIAFREMKSDGTYEQISKIYD